MFEVGFTEIVLIFGLALLVLGPEKLPKLAAQLGRWAGRARSMARQLRSQLDEEVRLGEQEFSRPASTYKPPPAPPASAATTSAAAATPESGAGDWSEAHETGPTRPHAEYNDVPGAEPPPAATQAPPDATPPADEPRIAPPRPGAP